MDVVLMLLIAFVLLVVSWFLDGGTRGRYNGNSSVPPYNDSWGTGGDGGSGGDAGGCDGDSSS